MMDKKTEAKVKWALVGLFTAGVLFPPLAAVMMVLFCALIILALVFALLPSKPLIVGIIGFTLLSLLAISWPITLLLLAIVLVAVAVNKQKNPAKTCQN